MSDPEPITASATAPETALPADPLIGRKLGDFLVREKLGQGGLGAVYRVVQPTLGREAVVKVLHPRNRNLPDVIQRFLRESRLASKLDHPYAAHIYAFGAEPDGLLWIAMELVRGTTLQQMLGARGNLSLPVLSQLMDRVAEVVHSAHDQGIIHRDLKPSNVMVLNRAGKLLPKLLDFGLAKLMLDDAQELQLPPSAGETAAEPTGAEPRHATLPSLDDRETPALPSSFDPLSGATPALGLNAAGLPGNASLGEKADAAIAAHLKSLGLSFEHARDRINALRPNAGSPPPAAKPALPPSKTPPAKVTYFAEQRTRPSKKALENKETLELQLKSTLNDAKETPLISARAAGEEDISGRLTPHGRYLGTPHYMAPEQWRGEEVDARSDLYALGVICYECLTGQLPFARDSVEALRQAHLEEPVPPLPEAIPAAVHTVLAKAMAKRREDRYSTALELARDLKDAAGLEDEPLSIPHVDETVRELILYQAPQPLAEALAAFDTARSEKAAVEELSKLFSLTAHLLGVLALAARARVGAGSTRDAQPVFESLRALRQGSLTPVAWLSLARELCRPFAKNRDAHPLPELVSFFFESSGDFNGAQSARLLDAWGAEIGAAPHGDEAAGHWLREVTPKVSRVLASLGFLHDYRWVAMRAWVAEEWMGLRRPRRQGVVVRGPELPEGELNLITREGVPVLSLHPLVQRLAPTPGATEELFLLQGQGRLGARLSAPPIGFERHDEGLWEWFRRNVLDADDQSPAEAQPDRSPYRGLNSFATEDAQNYFGREREAESFANRLRETPLLAVVGPSGVGKSSFVQAGVAPLLSDWKLVVMRPGPSPLGALVARLASLGLDVPDLRAQLVADRKVLRDALRALAPPTGGVILLVDQFEEVLTLCHDAEERALFTEALAEAAPSVEQTTRVVLTLRDDFLIRAQRLPGLEEKLSQGLQLLSTPAVAELTRTLTEPARRRGVVFEDAELPKEMAAAVSEQPGALAILSFTASKLWEVRDRTLKVMSRKAYEALGGVGGALAQHAEATLAQMPPDAQRLTREAFRRLVSAEGTRAVLTREEMGQVLGGGPVAESVLETLISARLLTTSEDGGADDRVEVIHEALLSSWPRLVRWQREDAENTRMRDQLRAAARQWDERGRPGGVLWRREALAEYRIWRARYQGKLTTSEESFTRASLAEEARGRWILRGALAGTFLLLAAGMAFLFQANARAEDRLHRLHAEQGRAALLRGEPLQALVFLTQARREGERGAGLDYMIAKARRAAQSGQLILTGHHGRVMNAVYSPDYRLIATAGQDGSVRLFRANDGQLVHVLERSGHEIYTATFSADGSQLVTGESGGTAELYDVTTGALLATFRGGTADLFDSRFTPRGDAVITASDDGNIRVYDLATKELRLTLNHPGGPVGMLAFANDGQSVIASSEPVLELGGVPEARVWSLRSGKLVALLSGHTGPVRFVSRSPNGKRLATASQDGSVRIWDTSTWKSVATLEGHWNSVTALAWRPDGKQLASASADRTIRLWDVEHAHLDRVIAGHHGTVRAIAFDPSGTMIGSSSDDATVRLWEASSGRELMTFFGHTQSVHSLAFSGDGLHLLTSSYDGTARVWNAAARLALGEFQASVAATWGRFSEDGEDVWVEAPTELQEWDARHPKLLRQLTHGASDFTGPGIAPDLTWFAAPDQRRFDVEVRSLDKSDLVRRLVGHTAAIDFVDVSPNGRQIISASEDATVRIWNATTGALEKTLRHRNPVLAAVFSPDGRWVLSGDNQGGVFLWSATSGVLRSELHGQGGSVSASFSSDGRRAVVGSTDQKVRILDVQTGSLLTTLEGHTGTINTAVFSPDNKLILSASNDGTAKVWDVEQGVEVDELRLDEPVVGAGFSPDGSRLVLVGTRGRVVIREAGRSHETAAELERFNRCNVAYALLNDQANSRPLSASDCAAR